MGQDERRSQQRGGGRQTEPRGQRSNGNGSKRPWQVLYPRNYQDREGNEKTEYLRIGVAWPLPNGGYSIEALGMRVLIKPPGERREGEPGSDG
jgi:hypothetical protein